MEINTEQQKKIQKSLTSSFYRAHRLSCKEEECEKCQEFKSLLAELN